MKILVVEDDLTVAQTLEFLLTSYNYAVDIAIDGAIGLEMAEVFDYDLMVLDLILPKLNGIELCQQLRDRGIQSPILLLTGQEGGHQKAIALNAGADDYVVKPFDAEELIARVQALLRRGQEIGQTVLTWGHLSIDPSSRQVAYGDCLLDLTPKEYAILELLLRTPLQPLSSQAILERVWTSLESPGEETVRVHIKDLRHKLTAAGAPRDLIKTRHRVGYQLNSLYSSPLLPKITDRLTPTQLAELKAVNEELRTTLEQLRSIQAELQQRNQELQAARDELEQRVSDRTTELQALYDLAPCGYHSLDAEGRIVQVNETELRMFGYAREEMIGRKITDFYTPEGLQIFQENYPKFIKQGWVNDLEFTVVRKDGSLLPISLSATAVKDAAGKYLMSRSILVDISERKQAEAALRESDTKYRSLFNSVDEGFHIIELIDNEAGEVVDYRFLEGNPAFERLTGLQNAMGKLGSEIAPRTESYWLETYDRVARTGEPQRIENYNKDTCRWYFASVSRVGGAGSRQVAIVFDDITARKRREANANFLAEITADFSRLSTADEIMGVVGAKVGTYLNISNCLLAEINEGQDRAIIDDTWHTPDTPDVTGVYRLSDFITAELRQAGRSGETIIIRDTQTDPRTDRDRYAALKIRAFVTVPFHHAGEWKYVFTVNDSVVRDWREDEIELIREMTHLTFPRLERARAEAAVAADLQDTQRLHNLSTRLTMETDIQVLYDEILATAIALMHADRGSLQILDRSGNELHLQSSQGFHPEAIAFWQRVRIGTGSTCSQALEGGERQIVPDIETCDFMAGTADLDYYRLCEIGAVQSTPLISRSGQTIGMFSTHWCNPYQPSDRKLRFLDLLARQAADLIEHRRAESIIQQQLLRERTIADISQDIRRSLSLDYVLSRTVERVRELLATDRAIVFRFDPDWQGEVVVESVGEGWLSILATTITDPCFRDRYIEPYRQGRVATMTDIDTEDIEPCYVELLKSFQIKANLVVPILQNNHLWGLLIAHHCAAPRQWQPEEIELLRQLATNVGIAIQQSELYERTQQELLARQAMQAVLVESEQRLQTILDNSPAAIYLLDRENNFLLVNRICAELVSKTPADLVGKSIYDFWPRDIADTFAANNLTVLETGQLLQTEQVVSHPDGQPHTYLTVKFPLHDAIGNTYAVCGISTDITDKKQMEAMFYRAQRMESLGTLASGIAHDLNNVFTPILIVGQMLRTNHPELDTRSQDLLRMLEESAKRGTSMIQQILTFARGTGGDPHPVQVEVVLRELIHILHPSFPPSIKLRAHIPDRLPWMVSADPTYLHQVLMNLCVNARDAMPDGGILSLTVERCFVDHHLAQTELNAQVGDYVVITIADTGTGIPPEVRDRIFDPFFTTKPQGQGTGLGLATVLGIVQDYGGFLQVFSTVGQGTKIKVYLPAIAG